MSIASLLVCVAVLAACGSDGGDGGDGGGASAGGGIFDGLSGTVTWYETAGGDATTARRDVVFPAFTEQTGVTVRQDYNSDSTKLFAAMESGNTLDWNVIEFPAVGDFLNAKEKGYLTPLDPDVVPVDQLEPEAYDKYGIRGERYGIVMAWNTDVWPESGKHPSSVTDVFNTKDFPGKRCLFGYPAFGATLESALLADGVPAEDLYPLDVDRALAKLDTIKDDVVWYERDAVKLLIAGECDLAVTWSGQVFGAVRKDNAPLAISWEDGMYAEAVFAIPKNAENIEAAQAMLAFLILDEETREEFVRRTAYPTAIKGVTYPDEIAPWLPLGDNLETVTPENAQYYKENLDELVPKFTKWLGS